MANPSVLQRDFLRMARDMARNQLPQGAVWNMVDWLPRYDAPLRGRGGWANAALIIDEEPAAVQVVAGIDAPFVNIPSQNLAVSDTGHLYKFVSEVVNTFPVLGTVYAAGTPLQNPVFHDQYVIFPSANGTTPPNRYNGSVVAPLGGSPPAGRYATVWNDYTLLASTVANPNRLYFSAPSDPNATWDTSQSFWDFSRPIKGLATLRNAILVFHDDAISRLRGDTPPPGGDLEADDPAFLVGTVDARSISLHADWCYFASTEGFFRTDGVSIEDLTRRGDISTFWTDWMTLAGTSGSTLGFTISSGVLNNILFTSVCFDGLFLNGFMCNLRDYSWSQISNVDAVTMWSSVTLFDEIFFGRGGQGVVGRLSPIFNPGSDTQYRDDGNGERVEPLLETAFYEGEPGEKSWKKCYVGYELRDMGLPDSPDDPLFEISAKEEPAEEFDTLHDYRQFALFPQHNGYRRSRFELHFSSEGIAFKFRQVGRGDLRLYGLEAEVHPRERSRLAQ